MRPKAFPKTPPAAGWTSEYGNPRDDKLDPGVAATVRTFRAMLWSVDDRPSRADVRETLRRIAAMTPAEAARLWADGEDTTEDGEPRWPDLDDSTEAEIERAHWEVVGRTGPPLAIALPELARHALDTMEPHTGRPPKEKVAVMFAAALVVHWHRLHGTPPTISDSSPFAGWADELFRLAGFADGNLINILQAGRKAAEADGRIHPRAMG